MHAMQRDGVALVKFLKWLEESVPSGKETELSVDRKLHEFRAAQPLYMGESFDTIAGYKEHGAIVHYSATPESDVTLQPKGFLLLDSGAQYLDGTTDITRTIALGELTEEEKTDYTLILKGHIALAMAKFPVGTRGAQLDVLARMPIWKSWNELPSWYRPWRRAFPERTRRTAKYPHERKPCRIYNPAWLHPTNLVFIKQAVTGYAPRT